MYIRVCRPRLHLSPLSVQIGYGQLNLLFGRPTAGVLSVLNSREQSLCGFFYLASLLTVARRQEDAGSVRGGVVDGDAGRAPFRVAIEPRGEMPLCGGSSKFTARTLARTPTSDKD